MVSCPPGAEGREPVVPRKRSRSGGEMGTPGEDASMFEAGNMDGRDLSAEHAEEERRLQEVVRDRVWLIFHHFHDNAMGKFGADARTLDANDFHEILEQSFYEEVARMLPTNSASPTQAEMEISSQIRYRVVFTHDCQAQSCSDMACQLCINNPKRPCGEVIFKRKYFENDLIMAKCGGPIKIRLLDVQTNELVKISTTLELFILKGPVHDQKFPSGIPHCACEGLSQCQLLLVDQEEKDERGEKVVIPLLQSDYLPNQPNGKVHIRLQDGEATLPNVKVFKSSEALLGGRRTPFRLYAGVPRDAAISPETVIPAVDPKGFVVATQRAKLQEKKERPFLDDPIASLEQIGGRRVETLGCLGEKKLELPHGTPGKVHTVRDFLKLGSSIQGHPQQKKEVLTLLKMNELQWAEAWEHAETAVQADNQLRVWWFNQSDLQTGLLYECETGEVKLKHPVGLIQMADTPHVMPCKDLPQEQQDCINGLHTSATENYNKPGHPGWEVYPFDSVEFKTVCSRAGVTMSPIS
eukprot:evm.model.scf_1152.1 EVM.evm.TU.scf_1152.1   scf_1152:2023-9350(+)